MLVDVSLTTPILMLRSYGGLEERTDLISRGQEVATGAQNEAARFPATRKFNHYTNQHPVNTLLLRNIKCRN